MTKNKLDEYDKAIVKELIINPRLSDNKISAITKIPVKTVNRKRRGLEEKGLIRYMVSVDNGPEGTNDFGASMMYLIRFRYGIYRKQFLDAYRNMPLNEKDFKHISHKWLCEKDGNLMLTLIIESRKHSDILEIYNVEILEKINKHLGSDAVKEVTTIPITTTLSLLHNYEPEINMKNSMIKEHWSRNLIFVSDR